jgi:ABC-type molybdate transport system substrate-binding protein
MAATSKEVLAAPQSLGALPLIVLSASLPVDEGRQVWTEVNAAQAARFAASGSAQAAILPLSLVRADELAGKGGFATLPESWHAPLRQRMALVKGAGEAARRFYAFLQSPEARAIFARHGFVLPDAGK